MHKGKEVDSTGLLNHKWEISCPSVGTMGRYYLSVSNSGNRIRLARSGWRMEKTPAGENILTYYRNEKPLLRTPTKEALENRYIQVSRQAGRYSLPESNGWRVWQLRGNRILAYPRSISQKIRLLFLKDIVKIKNLDASIRNRRKKYECPRKAISMSRCSESR